MNAIELEIYRHLLTSIAEEMGSTLMRAAFSPNIKERRDFSCAIFDQRAQMVAQAAHIPVHLASTPMSVRAAIDACKMTAGSHVVLNDPYCGGTHLPDITVVSPVIDDHGNIIFFVANRAHHADIGGISPGSLPLSTTIDDEGIRIAPTFWSEKLESEIAAASRTPDERRGDLRAQIAANMRGQQRLLEQWQSHGLRLLEAANDLQDYSERFMRQVLSELPDGEWEFEDVLEDDGFGNELLPLRCTVLIDKDKAVVDLRDSADQTIGPINVPRAVTVSAIMYVFRCLAPVDLPSNSGYMRCIDVHTRPGSILDATYPAAVAAGNVETSQRVTDVVMGALAKCVPERITAASCGTMNNIMIGGVDTRSNTSQPFAYYETIAGGSGAGEGFHGESAIQTHMTNTLNTPIEALEHAYPFRIDEYRVQKESGGRGLYQGGDGVVRSYVFESDATITLMTERRKMSPYGLLGGDGGKAGQNILRRSGKETLLPAKCTIDVKRGDIIQVTTPGGGGYKSSTSTKS